MYRMLIIDDEYLVRLGLKETIDWNAIGVTIVGEASNGLMGFNLALELKPDIIISDVKMPLVNGLDLVRKLKEENFNGRIIILSGYRDFEYAKETFENGVAAYVLKPVDNAEIIRVVVETLKDLQSERDTHELYQGLKEQMPVVKDQIFKDILIGNITIEADIESKLSLFGFPLIANGFLLLVKMDEENKDTTKNIATIQKEINSRLEGIDTIVYAFDRYLVMAVRLSDEEAFISKVRAAMHAYGEHTDATLSIGVAHYNGLANLKDAYLSVQHIVSQKLFLGLNTVAGDEETNPTYKKNVLSAMSLISKRYKENLTVKIVAEELRVSESYLMHLFKSNLGKTFNEVLTNYRVMVAKNLLASGKYRINEVSDLVGYTDVKYFSLVFRKVVGTTPSAYLQTSEKREK